jgi:hypothetical protein
MTQIMHPSDQNVLVDLSWHVHIGSDWICMALDLIRGGCSGGLVVRTLENGRIVLAKFMGDLSGYDGDAR